MSKIAGVLLIVATIAAGIYFDIVVMLVGGITEIVHGATAHPVSGSQIGWGVVHLVFSGIGVFAAFLLCALWVMLFFNPAKKATTRLYSR